jgi:hypothetical protein
MLCSGARWRDCPAAYGPCTTVYNRFQPVEPPRGLAGNLYGLGGLVRDGRNDGHRCHPRQSPPLGRRRKREAFVHAIGRSRGGRTTKIHAVSDGRGRPVAFLLTPGHIADISAAP